jgi:anti-sigma regulatory factor (Ser/Thr protein kinase)
MAASSPITAGIPRPAPRHRRNKNNRHPAPAAPHSHGSAPHDSPAHRARHAALSALADASRLRDIRQFTSAILARWHVADSDLDSCLLIVSELAGNSAQHGRSRLTVHLTLSNHTVRIDVADHGAAVEHPAEDTVSGDPCEHGRGLSIVQALADHCETQRANSGWHTRATLRIASPAGDPRSVSSRLPPALELRHQQHPST